MNDSSADSLEGRITLGLMKTLIFIMVGRIHFVVNKQVILNYIHKKQVKVYILMPENGTVEIKEDGTLMIKINNTGINIVSGRRISN